MSRENAFVSRVANMVVHPRRDELVGEVHARPSENVHAPTEMSHLAVLSGTDAADEERDWVGKLCQRYGTTGPGDGQVHFSTDMGGFKFRWERHTEFSTYTFTRAQPFDVAFKEPPITRVPADWLAEVPGEVIVALHLALEPEEKTGSRIEAISPLLSAQTLACSLISGGRARVWTDFLTHQDGFGRILVQDLGLQIGQGGRLVQRLLEIETYRLLALLALPVARENAPRLARIDREVSEVAAQITGNRSNVEDGDLLERLGGLAATVEAIGATSNYRFGAASAYAELVYTRLEGLREQRMEGLQTIREFTQRRLRPAMRTCEHTRRQLEELSTRTARASNLLRTRIDVALERQSRDLLASMDRRAGLQVRLQQTVESLSIVVLTYYGVGLVSYVMKGFEATGQLSSADLWTAVASPLVLLLVLIGGRRVQRSVNRELDTINPRATGADPGSSRPGDESG